MEFDALPILVAEDNDDDVFILRRALKHAAIKNPLFVATDGQEAVDYLAGAGKFADRESFPLPHLLLIDLKLPLRPGLEILRWMRSQPTLGQIVSVVLTSSAEHRDVSGARELGARYYLVKPPKPPVLAAMLTVFREELNAGPTAPRPLSGDLLAQPEEGG